MKLIRVGVDLAKNVFQVHGEQIRADHRRVDMAVPQQLTDCAHVLIPFQQVGCERMAPMSIWA